MATDRKVRVWLEANVSGFVRDMGVAAAAVKGLTKEINTSNDRTAWLAQSILALGPALVPLGAAAVPVLSGIATQMLLTAGAAGTAALAFSGIGDALGAVNDYQLKPTAANLEKMNLALAQVGPDGAEFVRFLDSIGPKFTDLQMASREGLFPGVEDGITSFLDLLPQLRDIVTEVSEAMGQLASEAGAGLAGDGFEEFFNYMETNARPLLMEMGHTIGNFAEGLGAMVVAFGPLTAQFSQGFESMSASFADWAQGLDESSTFQEFVEYVQQSIPRALEMLGALSGGFVSLLKAAAPVGDVMVPMLELLFDALSLFLDSPLGPVFLGMAAAMSVYGRAVALAQITTSGLGKQLLGVGKNAVSGAGGVRTLSTDLGVLTRNALTAGAATERMAASSAIAGKNVRSTAAGMGMAAGSIGLLAVAMSDLDDKAGLTNATMGAMIGIIGGGPGVALGALAGLALDAAAANDDLTASIEGVSAALASADLSTDLRPIQDQMEANRAAFEEFRDGVENVDMDTSFGTVLAAIKNDVEETFGTSDVDEFARELRHTEVEAQKLAGTYRTWLDPLRDATREQKNYGMASSTASREATRMVKRIEQQKAALEAAREAASDTAAEFVNLGDGLDNAKKSLDGWIKQLENQADALRNFQLNAVKAANRGLRQGLIQALQEAGPEGALRMRQLANASEEEIGRANRAWLRGQKVVKNYERTIAGVPAFNLQIQDAEGRNRIKAVQALLDKFGMTKAEAKAFVRDAATSKIKTIQTLIDKYGITRAEAVVLLNDMASGKIDAVRQKLRDIDNTSATTYMNVVTRYSSTGTPGGRMPSSADGNIFPSVRANAYGDIANRHMPELAGPGVTRVWREPETQGEAYIPLANDDRRPRAEAIWEQTGRMLGIQFQRFAQGGVRFEPRASIPAAPSVSVNLAGLRIEGQIEMNDRGGYLRGVIAEEIGADRRFQTTRQGR